MKFLGVDLTSCFSVRPRAIDLAILDDDLNATFRQTNWPSSHIVTARDPAQLLGMTVGLLGFRQEDRAILAIDGPQGLAPDGQNQRTCERILGTPGRTPCQLPPAKEGEPFQGYIRSSVDLFASLVKTTPPSRLAGFNGISLGEANLFEVFPGAEWVVLAGKALPAKATAAGREARRRLFAALGVKLSEASLPTADQHDALVGAYLAWCVHHKPESVEPVGIEPFLASNELREGFILHATASGRVNTPVIVEGQDGGVAPPPESTRTDPSSGNDWNQDDTALLFLNDYGVVWGKQPENAWLTPETNYQVEIQPPQARTPLTLTYAPAVSGGLGWRATPFVKTLLAQLGLPTPAHLSRRNGVTLRVKVLSRTLS